MIFNNRIQFFERQYTSGEMFTEEKIHIQVKEKSNAI